MKKYLYLLAVLLYQCFLNCTKETVETNIIPVRLESDHFTFMLYNGLSQSVLEPIQNKLEDSYSRVFNDLDVNSMNQLTVKIWNNESDFLDNMRSTLGVGYQGASGWVAGASDLRILYQGSSSAQVVLHEFYHCVSLVVNPTIVNNPHWLWESIAIYESGEFKDPQIISYLEEDHFPTLEEQNSDFNTGNHNIYQVGYLLTEFIIFTWVNDSYVNLIKSNGNIIETLEISIEEFEIGWKEFVTEKYL